MVSYQISTQCNGVEYLRAFIVNQLKGEILCNLNSLRLHQVVIGFKCTRIQDVRQEALNCTLKPYYGCISNIYTMQRRRISEGIYRRSVKGGDILQLELTASTPGSLVIGSQCTVIRDYKTRTIRLHAEALLWLNIKYLHNAMEKNI